MHFDFSKYGSAFFDMRLHKLRVLLTAQTDDLFIDLGISVPSTSVSVVLFLAQKKRASIAQISEGIGYSHQLINQRLAILEKAGFTSRLADARDKRRAMIILTPKGRAEAEKLEAAMTTLSALMDSLFTQLGFDLNQGLIDITESLNAQPLAHRLETRDPKIQHQANRKQRG